MRDFKYFAAYTIPILAIVGLYVGGIWTFGSLIMGFVLIPIIEPIIGQSDTNLPAEVASSKLSNRLFDVLLYLNAPLIYGAIVLFGWQWIHADLSTFEWVGNTASLGIVLGASGINVAHELGHRKSKFERFLAKALLLPSHYMHFYIEHNRGHHKNVATDLDPASARRNEWIYAFWVRSTVMSYISAWKLEAKRLNKTGQSVYSLHNEMIRFQLIQLAYLVVLFLVLNPLGASLLIVAGVIGFLLLETINYIEHYGLRRKPTSEHSFERVKPKHSWNSNYEMGRIMLYELTRHADHHYLAVKKYQVLDSIATMHFFVFCLMSNVSKVHLRRLGQ